MLKLDIQMFSGNLIYDFIINKTIANNQVTVKLTPDTSDIIDLGVDVNGNHVYIDDSCDFSLEGWTKVNDGEGSLSKVYTANTTEEVTVEYTTINANVVTFTGIVEVTEIGGEPVAQTNDTYIPTDWKSGTVTKPAHVTIDGVEYPVTPATVTGGTPINVTNLKKMEDGIVNLFNMIYPVGSIYMSILEINPSQLFGFGTWEQIKDTFLLSAGDKYSAGSTGGEATHTLTINEMPSHKHDTNEIAFGNPTWSGSISNHQLAHSNNTNNHIYVEGGTKEGNFYTFRGGGTNEVGGGQAHNNMPPYLAVYMWKRVA